VNGELVVVDTNVPLTANGAADASLDCVAACIAAVREVVEDRHRLAIDDDYRIIREYMNRLRASGEPGWGDRFLRWVLTHQRSERCIWVPITATDEDAGEFAEFPHAEELGEFDRSDRKFVAVANAHPAKPPILQGVDSKWWGWRGALRAAGIRVRFLCEAEIAAKYEKKFSEKST
jgi:hypothetical protein